MRLRDLPRRTAALLLALLFLGGELGWSGLDALAFHTEGVPAGAAASVAVAPGSMAALLAGPTSPGEHGAHCVLGLTTGSARASAPTSLNIHLEPEIAFRVDASVRRGAERSDPGTLARPRAPPFLPA